MSYICLLYANDQHAFAHHLAVQLGQRGLVVWPVPDPGLALPEDDQAVDTAQVIADASHFLVVLPASEEDLTEWQAQIVRKKRVFVVQCAPGVLPDWLDGCTVIDFEGPFLLGVEELVRRLGKAKAPARPSTETHAPPVVKAGLLPMKLPSERCWREDRLRINYNLPILLTDEDLAVRIPAFLEQAGFRIERATRKTIRARRVRDFHLFDPRRTIQTLTIKPRKGRVRVYYRMTRLQVFYWFHSHYLTLDREAAALYRYLATGTLNDDLLAPVRRQAKRARMWCLLMLAVIALSLFLFVGIVIF